MAHQTPAYLFRSTVNLEAYAPERQEQLSTGVYILVDMRCRGCYTPLGWRYISAQSEVLHTSILACKLLVQPYKHCSGAGDDGWNNRRTLDTYISDLAQWCHALDS